MTYSMRLMRGSAGIVVWTLLLALSIPLRILTALVAALVAVSTHLDEDDS